MFYEREFVFNVWQTFSVHFNQWNIIHHSEGCWMNIGFPEHLYIPLNKWCLCVKPQGLHSYFIQVCVCLCVYACGHWCVFACKGESVCLYLCMHLCGSAYGCRCLCVLVHVHVCACFFVCCYAISIAKFCQRDYWVSLMCHCLCWLCAGWSFWM